MNTSLLPTLDGSDQDPTRRMLARTVTNDVQSNDTNTTAVGKSRAAWLREMERAQINQWFAPFEAARSSTSFGTASLSRDRPSATSMSPTKASTIATPNLYEALRWSAPPSMPESWANGQNISAQSERFTSRSATATMPQEPEAENGLRTRTGQSRTPTNFDRPDAAIEVTPKNEALSREVSLAQIKNTSDLGKFPHRFSRQPIADVLASKPLEAATFTPTPPQLVFLHSPAFAAVAHTLQITADGSKTISANPNEMMFQVESVSSHASASPMACQAKTTQSSAGIDSFSLVRVRNGAKCTRVHTQWTPEGLELWLGMDGTAPQIAAQAALLFSELRDSMNAQGQRLSRFVCNGQVFWDAKTGKPASKPVVFSQVLAQQASIHYPSSLPIVKDIS